uniref:Glycosyltransferase n=1 Tax=viral metagenome TaxID=1070528 RepID=A0A6H2A169_9ZZZZ
MPPNILISTLFRDTNDINVYYSDRMQVLGKPMNTQYLTFNPIGYTVHDGRNLVATLALEMNIPYLLFVDNDTIIPPDALIKLFKHMPYGDIVGGLYYSKTMPPYPLLFRGRGNGSYENWTDGDIVQVDGLGMGCTLIKTEVFKKIIPVVKRYVLCTNKEKNEYKEVYEFFRTRDDIKVDAHGGVSYDQLTEDLHFCEIVKSSTKMFIDTGIKCGHYDKRTGVIFSGENGIKKERRML